MKPVTYLALILALPMLTACKGELAVVTLTLAADGSGECEIAGIRDAQRVADPAANPGGVLHGASDVKSFDLQVRQTTAKFQSIDAFKLGDVAFERAKQDGKNLLTVRIPAYSDASWYTAFGVSARALELWDRAREEPANVGDTRKKHATQVNGVSFEPPRPPNVAFNINLPGRFEGQDFETVPLGLETKVVVDRDERQASISIPLSEVHGGRLKEIIWKIRYSE
jgi:hypothetical protein